MSGMSQHEMELIGERMARHQVERQSEDFKIKHGVFHMPTIHHDRRGRKHKSGLGNFSKGF